MCIHICNMIYRELTTMCIFSTLSKIYLEFQRKLGTRGRCMAKVVRVSEHEVEPN